MAAVNEQLVRVLTSKNMEAITFPWYTEENEAKLFNRTMPIFDEEQQWKNVKTFFPHF